MSNTFLYILWGILYVGCAALGIFNAPPWAGVMGCISFFIPPALLLWKAGRQKDRKTVLTVRNLALVWLGTTLALMVLNILSVAMSEAAGRVLHYMMVVLTSPMVCGQKWIIAMFLWSYVLMHSLQQLKRMK